MSGRPLLQNCVPEGTKIPASAAINIFSHLLNKAMMFLCFGAVVKPDKQNFPHVSVFAVSCGVVLFLYLVQGILSGVIPLELNNHDRKIRSALRDKHQIRKTFPCREFPEAVIAALGAPHKPGYETEYQSFLLVISRDLMA